MTIKSNNYSIQIFGRRVQSNSRPLQFHSKIGRKDNIYKTWNTVGSKPALWWFWMAFNYKNTVHVFCETALNGPTWMGRSFFERPSATIQLIQSSTEGIGKYYNAQKGIFNLTLIIGHWTSGLLWCINCSLCRTSVCTKVFRRIGSLKDVDIKYHSRTNKELLRFPMGSTPWSKFGGRSIIIFERSMFPDTKGVRLDRFNGNTCLASSFVANRVAKNENIIPSSIWNFVPTEENSAECASREI